MPEATLIRDVDEALLHVSDLVESELDWDRIEPELETALDVLVEAGYVEEWGHSTTGSFWGLTDAGIDRLDELGRS